MFNSGADIILVTTNSFVKNNGELVMGAGAAKEAKRLYPELPKQLGVTIPHLGKYHLRFLPNGLGAFQVKYDWQHPASIDLIAGSSYLLRDFANMFVGTIALNFPGIGNGKLDRDRVLPVIGILPDNVHVYEL